MKNEAYSISATDIEIWAPVGVHQKEALVENCFRVSVNIDAGKPYERNNYINYETIMDCVKTAFGHPHKILEDVCVEIIDEIKQSVNGDVYAVECEIKKVRPAVEGMVVGTLSVRIKKNFK